MIYSKWFCNISLTANPDEPMELNVAEPDVASSSDSANCTGIGLVL